MNLAPLLRQTVQWQASTGVNARGEHTYAAAVPTRARSVGKVRDIFHKDGESTTVTTQVTMLAQPAVGDIIDGREVVQVIELVAFDGTTAGWQALTR